jgi:hypothetical protein
MNKQKTLNTRNSEQRIARRASLSAWEASTAALAALHPEKSVLPH